MAQPPPPPPGVKATSIPGVPTPIFELKEGNYLIQNVETNGFLDVNILAMELCCRPVGELGPKPGLWQIKKFGDGYMLKKAGLGSLSYTSPTKGMNTGDPICVSSYPVAWRVKRVEGTGKHHGHEFVQFFWGDSNKTFDLWEGSHKSGTPVKFFELNGKPWQMWRLTPDGEVKLSES